MGGGASTGSFTVEFASQVATTVCSNFLSSGKCSKDEAEVRSLRPSPWASVTDSRPCMVVRCG